MNSSGPLLEYLYSLGIPMGGITITIQSIMFLLCTVVFLISKKKKIIVGQLFKLAILWLPWLIYLLLRCDFNDPYSVKKFGLIFGLEFVSLIFICISFIEDSDKFAKIFYTCTILIASVMLIIFLLHPTSFMYANRVQRLGIENVNVIWLARSFAIGAMCFLLSLRLYISIKYTGFIIFAVAIIPTGSRGPIISLLITYLMFWIWQHTRSVRSIIIAVVLMCVILPLALVAFDKYQNPIDKYLSRGTKKSMLVESGRLAVVREVVREFSSAPILGVGLGKYGRYEHSGSFTVAKDGSKQYVRLYPHNVIFEVLAELGLFGVSIFILVLQPSKWLLNLSDGFVWLFILCMLFSVSSGDLTGNPGLFIFSYLARVSTSRNADRKLSVESE